MLELERNTNNPHNVVRNLFLYFECTVIFGAESSAVITPAMNSQALFCGAKYSVVPTLEILLKRSKGVKRYKRPELSKRKTRLAGWNNYFLSSCESKTRK